jgi:putative salt-induced outer membrane protein YdiY
MKAFPIVIDRETQLANNTNFAVQEDGMDLRDYFAGQVIVGFLANSKADYSSNLFVKLAYEMADEMMKAREK